jgi:hypothetical protein
VHVIADLFDEVAEASAKEYGIPEWCGVEKALNPPDVESSAPVSPALPKDWAPGTATP